jgi:hypothetical protein
MTVPNLLSNPPHRVEVTTAALPLVPTRTAPSHTPSAPAKAAAALLDQAARFIESLTDDTFVTPSTRIHGGTIGKHFRHCLDHFAAALSPLIASFQGAAESVIDYDHRERNVPMESSRAVAIAEIRAVRESLLTTGALDVSRLVTVRVMLTSDGEEAELPSTFGRELAFATHHAVHHHAMIRSIAEEFGASVPPEFGKAPATLHFES